MTKPPNGAVPYAIEHDGLRLAVRLTPRAHKTGLDRILLGADGRPVLQVRIAAPPVEGAANQALIAFLAGELGVPKTRVTIKSGTASRVKILHVSGDGPALSARMREWLAWLMP